MRWASRPPKAWSMLTVAAAADATLDIALGVVLVITIGKLGRISDSESIAKVGDGVITIRPSTWASVRWSTALRSVGTVGSETVAKS